MTPSSMLLEVCLYEAMGFILVTSGLGINTWRYWAIFLIIGLESMVSYCQGLNRSPL